MPLNGKVLIGPSPTAFIPLINWGLDFLPNRTVFATHFMNFLAKKYEKKLWNKVQTISNNGFKIELGEFIEYAQNKRPINDAYELLLNLNGKINDPNYPFPRSDLSYQEVKARLPSLVYSDYIEDPQSTQNKGHS